MKKEAIVGAPHAQAGVGPFSVMDDLQGFLNARRSRWTDVATVVDVVIIGAVVAVWEDSIRVPGDRFGQINL